MIEWVLQRPTVIGFAVIGGVFSLAAIVLRKRGSTSNLAARLDTVAYGFMGVSVVLFIVIGIRGPQS